MKIMKYYEVTVHDKYTPPNPIGWYGTLDPKTLSLKGIHGIRKHILLLVEDHMQMSFTDVITFPCFMLSALVRDVIGMYDTDISFARIIFLDRKNRESRAYYIVDLPMLYAANGGKRAMMKVNNKSTGKEIVVMRMDLVESILRRGAVGMGLKEYGMEGAGNVIY